MNNRCFAVILGAILLSPISARELSFEDRVAAQKAIEEVYWRHRVWPQPSRPKPPLGDILDERALRAKVADQLQRSSAITHEQLQEELNRMARDTREPQVLRELFEALGNDPFLIAETLVRPSLADRSDAPGTTEAEPTLFVLPSPAAGSCTLDSWTATPSTTGRSGHSAVWTGSEMIVWGGNASNTGSRYSPATDSWTATSVGVNVPSERGSHTAVWTGTEMIVWGGLYGSTYLDTGGRYDPVTDSWTATSAGPAARQLHTAVWTGREMIVFGGMTSPTSLTGTGSRYDPVADSWTPINTSGGAGAPGQRYWHTAVWTGTQMIVWGGDVCSGTPCMTDSGARYNPLTDTWTAMTSTSKPSPRSGHSALWTGSEMIVWGGSFVLPPSGSATYFNTGGRYDPATDAWQATPTANAPTGRHWHSAAWTGKDMIVWGGVFQSFPLRSGGRYDPATNDWAATTSTNSPTGRYLHTAVWTPTEMIVWGGQPSSPSGGRYCACPNGRMVYRDSDADGHGTASATAPSCDGTVPAGYALDATDCNDADTSVYAHAAEVNDGLDNQCLGDTGYGLVDEISGLAGFFTAGNASRFSWPPQSGATSYEVVRSTLPDFNSGCTTFASSDPFIDDAQNPTAGGAFYYLVRAASPQAGEWGRVVGCAAN